VDDIGEVLFSARSFDEYRAMFALTDADLTGRVLDCPGGAASFTAEALDRGVDAVAVDPRYADDRVDLTELAERDTVRGNDFLRDPVRAARFVWRYFASPDDHLAQRVQAARRFADDLGRPGRYVAAALPRLPFADSTFDLVLSSHFLFTYAERLDLAFHIAALCELHRVCRGQVRVFPLLGHTDGRRYSELDAVRHRLDLFGVGSEIRPVDYEFQAGGDQMLVLLCTHATTRW